MFFSISGTKMNTYIPSVLPLSPSFLLLDIDRVKSGPYILLKNPLMKRIDGRCWWVFWGNLAEDYVNCRTAFYSHLSTQLDYLRSCALNKNPMHAQQNQAHTPGLGILYICELRIEQKASFRAQRRSSIQLRMRLQ